MQKIYKRCCTLYQEFLGRDIFHLGTFFKGRKGHTEGNHQIVMLFLPLVITCLLEKALQNGGHRQPRTPICTYLYLSNRQKLYVIQGCE